MSSFRVDIQTFTASGLEAYFKTLKACPVTVRSTTTQRRAKSSDPVPYASELTHSSSCKPIRITSTTSHLHGKKRKHTSILLALQKVTKHKSLTAPSSIRQQQLLQAISRITQTQASCTKFPTYLKILATKIPSTPSLELRNTSNTPHHLTAPTFLSQHCPRSRELQSRTPSSASRYQHLVQFRTGKPPQLEAISKYRRTHMYLAIYGPCTAISTLFDCLLVCFPPFPPHCIA